MNTDNLFERNRSAWNQALEYHQRARGQSLQTGFASPAFTAFDRDCDRVLLDKLEAIDWNGKVIAQMPCNNGRELLSLMKLGAGEAVGFDISDTAIQEARQLAAIAGLNVRFERTNILDIADHYNASFDFIYISEGSLQWFPDLGAYFRVVSRLLRTNGRMLVFEMHPFAYFFENGFDPQLQNWDAITPYFQKGPYHYRDGLDYVGGVKYEAAECHWFMHTLSDILKAVTNSGIGIESFDEYNLEMANQPGASFSDRFPLSYILTGKKRPSGNARP